jgi:hypothetical protein
MIIIEDRVLPSQVGLVGLPRRAVPSKKVIKNN